MVSGRTPTAVARSDTRSARATVGNTARTLDLGAGSKVKPGPPRRTLRTGDGPRRDSTPQLTRAPGRGPGSAAARGAPSASAALAALVGHGTSPAPESGR